MAVLVDFDEQNWQLLSFLFLSWRGRQGTLKQSNQSNNQIQEIPQNWTGKPTPAFPSIFCYVSMQNTQQEVLYKEGGAPLLKNREKNK